MRPKISIPRLMVCFSILTLLVSFFSFVSIHVFILASVVFPNQTFLSFLCRPCCFRGHGNVNERELKNGRWFFSQAGVTGLWYKYVGLDGKVVGVDKYGMSAPGDIVFEEYGMSAANLIAECKSYI